jgi:hypothetical protein
MRSSLRGCRIARWRVRWHRAACRNPGRLDTDRHGDARGRVIPHAKRLEASTSATVALPVPVVEPTFGAQTMAAARAPQALRAGFGRAALAAVDVTPVAAPADGEHGLATRASRQSQRQRHGVHGLRSVPTRTPPPTLPDPGKRATIRVGRACVPSKTGARPLEDSERLLRVLTCFGRR